MSDSRRDVPSLLGDLVRSVEELQTELEPEGRPPLRPPTPRELARFTSEVTIPALVLVLETNLRALELLQRTLRLATGTDTDVAGSGTRARERAQAIGRRTLAQLDDVLADLQRALEGRPPDDPARELLDEARDLSAEIDTRLASEPTGDGNLDGEADASRDPTQVDIDVESELQSIKDDLDGNGPDNDG